MTDCTGVLSVVIGSFGHNMYSIVLCVLYSTFILSSLHNLVMIFVLPAAYINIALLCSYNKCFSEGTYSLLSCIF